MAGREPMEDAGWSWASVRKKCIQEIDLLLANPDIKWTEFLKQDSLNGLDESRISNKAAFEVARIVHNWAQEAIALSSASPGDFEETMEAFKCWKKLLSQEIDAESALKEMDKY